MGQRLAAVVRQSALAAMPYEVVETTPGTEAHRLHRVAMEEEIRRAAVTLPAEMKNSFSEMVGSIVDDIMDTAHRERRDITARLLPNWRTMSAEEKAPWEKQHAAQMEHYLHSLQLHHEGEAHAPLQPPGAYFAWIAETTRYEWARRHDHHAGA